MFAHHEKQDEEGAPSSGRGTTHGLGAPSYSNTRETNGDSHPRKSVGKGLEVLAVDGTERGLITTNGKRSTLTLTPVPLDTASSRVALIDWLAFSFKPPSDEQDHILPLLSKLESFLAVPSLL